MIYRHDAPIKSDGSWIPSTGDLRVTQHLDYYGKKNLRGRHTNCGYSGNILVFVHDGERWAWLRNKDKPQLPRNFAFQYEAEKLIEDYITFFDERLTDETEFKFWWWKGKRFAKVEGGLGDLELEVKKNSERRPQVWKGTEISQEWRDFYSKLPRG
jgi:hypothetical protein